ANGSGYDGLEDALRRGFRRLVKAAGGGLAGGRARRLEPAAGLGKPGRGDRELGQIAAVSSRQSYHADHPASGEASAFAGYRSAQQLAQIDPTGSNTNPQPVAG